MANKVKVTADNTFPRCLAQTQAFPFPHHGTYLSGNLPLQISKGHPRSALVAWEGAAITALYFAEAFKCCEILANPFLGFSEPFQFRCGVSSALLASVFWKIFGFMAISTPFFFPTRNNPVFYRPRKHCNFLTPIVFWHQQEGQIPLAFSQLTKSQGCILHILLSSKNSCKAIPELHFLPRLQSLELFHISACGWESFDLLRRSLTFLPVVFQTHLHLLLFENSKTSDILEVWTSQAPPGLKVSLWLNHF